MFVDIDKLQGIIDNLNNYHKSLNEVFTNQDNNVKLIEDSNVWHGTACESAIMKYKEMNKTYTTVLNNLDVQIKFLTSVKENYLKQEQDLMNQSNDL